MTLFVPKINKISSLFSTNHEIYTTYKPFFSFFGSEPITRDLLEQVKAINSKFISENFSWSETTVVPLLARLYSSVHCSPRSIDRSGDGLPGSSGVAAGATQHIGNAPHVGRKHFGKTKTKKWSLFGTFLDFFFLSERQEHKPGEITGHFTYIDPQSQQSPNKQKTLRAAAAMLQCTCRPLPSCSTYYIHT